MTAIKLLCHKSDLYGGIGAAPLQLPADLDADSVLVGLGLSTLHCQIQILVK